MELIIRPSPDGFFSQNKPRKIKPQNNEITYWFPLENKLRFLNFPVGAGGVVVQKKPPNFSLLIFHRFEEEHGFSITLKNHSNALLAYFFAS